MKRALLIDVGNTNTDFAVTDSQRIVTVPTAKLTGIPRGLGKYDAAVLSSVVPAMTKRLLRCLRVKTILVNSEANLGVGIRYPNKKQIGADRLANAVGVVNLYGAPAIVVDFGTAVTFDVVNARREYTGGVIAPGLAAMTDYLHEHTALLPHIDLREPKQVVGKSTVDAMMVGAVVGYRGLVKEILTVMRRAPGMRNAVVVATGGYGDLIARKVPAIRYVNPRLTLEGLRFIYLRSEKS
ncbi:MAG: type III pantothenate kinase [Verrucomicrobiota bacterium]